MEGVESATCDNSLCGGAGMSMSYSEKLVEQVNRYLLRSEQTDLSLALPSHSSRCLAAVHESSLPHSNQSDPPIQVLSLYYQLNFLIH